MVIPAGQHSNRCDNCGVILTPGQILGHIMAPKEWFCSTTCVNSWLENRLHIQINQSATDSQTYFQPDDGRMDTRHPEYLTNQHRLKEWHEEKRLNLRIFNNPNHPHYGPVRRMHIILMQLGLDSFIDSNMLKHLGAGNFIESWDARLSAALTKYPELSESQHLTMFLGGFFDSILYHDWLETVGK